MKRALAIGALSACVAAFAGGLSKPPADAVLDVPHSSKRFHADSLQALRAQIQLWLEASYKQEGLQVQSEFVGAWRVADLPLPEVEVSVQRGKRDHSGTTIDLIACAVQQPECSTGTAPALRYRVQAMSPVWSLTGPYLKGDVLSCEGMRQTWRVQKADEPQAAWQGSCDSLAEMRARRPLQPGDVLKVSDVMPSGGVLDKQDTLVIARLGGIEIQAKGMALADARVGQQVPVRLSGQANVVHGVVSAPGVVRVLEGL